MASAIPNISRTVDQAQFSALLQPTKPFIALSYALIASAVLLNGLELIMIGRKIKEVTNFEIVLFNLATADFLNSILFIAVTVMTHSSTNGKELRNGDAFYWVIGILAFSVIGSVTFVAMIGLERFFAIKVPLQHRLWHTRKLKLVKYAVITWLIDVIVIASVIIIDHLVNGRSQVIISSEAIYFLAGILTLGLVLILVLYIWVLHLMLRRSLKLFDFDKKILRINPKMIKDAIKKERSSITICALVVVSFMICNIPMVIDLFQLQISMTSTILFKLSAVTNPLIYFFKGHLEKYYARQRLISFSTKGSEELERSEQQGKKSAELIESGKKCKSPDLRTVPGVELNLPKHQENEICTRKK